MANCIVLDAKIDPTCFLTIAFNDFSWERVQIVHNSLTEKITVRDEQHESQKFNQIFTWVLLIVASKQHLTG